MTAARLRDLLVPRPDRPVHAAVLVGLATAAVAAFFLVSSASESTGWPVERAEVVAVEDHGGLLSSCGRHGGPAKDVTLRSEHPPPGLDTTFVMEDECQVDEDEVGDVWPVARVVGEDGVVTAYSFPMTVGEAWRQSLLAAGVAFVATLVLLPLWGWARRRYGRPEHQRS